MTTTYCDYCEGCDDEKCRSHCNCPQTPEAEGPKCSEVGCDALAQFDGRCGWHAKPKPKGVR